MSSRRTARPAPRVPVLCVFATLVFATAAPARGQSNAAEQSMLQARRWTAAKFLGTVRPTRAAAHLMLYTKSGGVARNRIGGYRFRIHNQEFDRGLAMTSLGEVLVRLPAPGGRFDAIVGVDSNDLGYYSNAGRGDVIASVMLGDREAFRSAVMREGLAGIPVSINLAGAREFSLKLAAAGERPRTHQAVWDQADWAEARVTLADGSTLWLADLPAGPLPPPPSSGPPFSFRYGDRGSRDLLPLWRERRSTRDLDAYRTEYTSTYTDPKTGLLVRCVAIAYRDFPTVEWTVYFKNTGTAPTPILETIEALDTGFQHNNDQEFLLHHSRGSPNSPTDYQPLETVLVPKSETRIGARGGRPTDTDLCYFNVDWAGSGVIIALGWPGQWSALFTRDGGTGLRIRAGQELTHFRLLPGEEVRAPLVALQFWNGNWISAQNTWRRWMLAHNLPRPGGKLPSPQLADSSARQTVEMQEANEENQKRFLQRDLDAGIHLDYWWMDAGWYPFNAGWWNTGTWEPDPKRFPHGLAPIAAAAHARAVKIIVWFEPERVTPGSWLYEHHPEWLIGENGRDKLLYLGNPDAWQWLVDHVSTVIREQGIDLYRQDFNFAPLALWRAHDTDDRRGITEIKHVSGYLAYWDELRRRFPGMLIDTCASGGRRNDLETLRRAVPLWRSDHAYVPTDMQQLTYGMALWIPYFGTAVNSVDPYIFRSQMTPAMGLGLDPARYPDGYQKLRQLLAEWRRVADYYYGDYYPLTPYRTEDTDWIAWQFHLPDRRQGMVQAFRRQASHFESARFKLLGLDPAAQYAVTDLDSTAKSEFGGRELMDAGLPVTIKGRPGAEILIYKRLESGTHK